MWSTALMESPVESHVGSPKRRGHMTPGEFILERHESAKETGIV
jgi:hypothetical protein